MPAWVYLVTFFAAVAAILGVAGFREGARPKGLKPPVDSGKF